MPELPDIELYLQALRPRLLGKRLDAIRIATPFLLRTTAPPLGSLHGCMLETVCRLGKRIVFGVDSGAFLVLHLMVAGRLRWADRTGLPIPKKIGLAALDVADGTLVITEAGSTRRASLHVARDAAALNALDPGGLEVLTADHGTFHERLTARRHTLKRALTDPAILSGIGNAYSDEILHRARLSPFRMTDGISPEESLRLHDAAVGVLTSWRDRLVREHGTAFPSKVTAFHPEMAVHGRYNRPCHVCGTAIQRIRYASNEANYCPTCQTGGRLLADRALSKLLGDDWPKTLEELERLKAERR